MARVDLAKLRKRAAAQLGLFTRSQARECGASPDQILRRVRSGDWQRVLGPVLATAEVQRTRSVMDRAAALAVPGGILAGPSAARAWGLAVPDPHSYLAVGRDRHPRIRGVRYLRFDVPRRDVTRWQGALVTTRQRTVLDCLRLLPEAVARNMLDRALHIGWLSVEDLATCAQASTNRPGMPQLRRLLRGVASGSRFEAERRAASLFQRARITGWEPNAPIYDDHGLIGFGDFVFRAARLVVEIDGFAFHVTTSQFQTDRSRQNRLIASGWRVLRFTWFDITERPEYVANAVRSML